MGMGQISTFRKINNLNFPYYRNKNEMSELSSQVKKLDEKKGADRIRKVFGCSQVHGRGQGEEEGPLKCINHMVRRVQGQPKELSVTEARKQSFNDVMSCRKGRNQQHQMQKRDPIRKLLKFLQNMAITSKRS